MTDIESAPATGLDESQNLQVTVAPISQEMVERAMTGSVPGISREQQERVTQPLPIDASGRASGIGGAARSLARLRNLITNNKALAKAERAIFEDRCRRVVEIQTALDEQEAAPVLTAAMVSMKRAVMSMEADLRAEIRNRFHAAWKEMEHDMAELDGSNIAPPLRDQMKIKMMNRFFVTVETDERLARSAVERLERFSH